MGWPKVPGFVQEIVNTAGEAAGVVQSLPMVSELTDPVIAAAKRGKKATGLNDAEIAASMMTAGGYATTKAGMGVQQERMDVWSGAKGARQDAEAQMAALSEMLSKGPELPETPLSSARYTKRGGSRGLRTLLTSPSGVTGTAAVQKKTLLGQ